MSSNPSFNQWLNTQRGKQHPIGDLAADVAFDPNFPTSSDPEVLRDYLFDRNPALESVFEAAWKAYSKRYPERAKVWKGIVSPIV